MRSRHRPRRATRRSGAGGALHPSSLRHSGHRLGARDRGAQSRGRARLLPALLYARKRHSGGRGRRRARRSARARRGDLRQDQARGREAARAPAPLEPPTVANRLVTVCRRQGRAAGLAAALSRAVAPHRARAKPKRSNCSPICSAADRRASSTERWSSRNRSPSRRRAYYHGAARRPEPVHRQHDARARRLARDARQRVRPGAGEFVQTAIDAGDLERAKTRMVADAIYARDSQSDLRAGTARRWRSARPCATSRNGRRGSRRSAPRTCQRRRAPLARS